jgi:hypothetical protein
MVLRASAAARRRSRIHVVVAGTIGLIGLIGLIGVIDGETTRGAFGGVPESFDYEKPHSPPTTR